MKERGGGTGMTLHSIEGVSTFYPQYYIITSSWNNKIYRISTSLSIHRHNSRPMVNYYDELEIEDFAWDPTANVFHYPCPCGDRFEISKSQLRDGEEIAICPSCSLIVRVIYDYVSPATIALD